MKKIQVKHCLYLQQTFLKLSKIFLTIKIWCSFMGRKGTWNWWLQINEMQSQVFLCFCPSLNIFIDQLLTTKISFGYFLWRRSEEQTVENSQRLNPSDRVILKPSRALRWDKYEKLWKDWNCFKSSSTSYFPTALFNNNTQKMHWDTFISVLTVGVYGMK